MRSLYSLIQSLEVTNYPHIFAVPLNNGERLTGPLTGLLPTLLQYACIEAVLELPGVGFPEVKGCVIRATALRGGISEFSFSLFLIGGVLYGHLSPMFP